MLDAAAVRQAALADDWIGAMRRLLILASTMVFFDVAFYAAIAPLLPDYVAEFGLSKAEAGILAASYAAGTLLASLPAGLRGGAVRAAPHRDRRPAAARRLQRRLRLRRADRPARRGALRPGGRRGADLVGRADLADHRRRPPERRGSVIGTALGTAVAGALLGPVLGALAAEVGTEAGLRRGARRRRWCSRSSPPACRRPGAASAQDLREVAATILTRPILTATAFVAVPSLMFGAVEVLVPLRIDELGGGHVADRRRLHRRRRARGGAWRRSPAATRTGSGAARRSSVGLSICAVAMVAIAVGAGARRGARPA